MPSEGFDPADPLGLNDPAPAEDAPQVEVIDVVTTVGALDAVVVTLREFLHRSGAVRAVTLLPDGEDPERPPRLVDCARLQPIEVVADGRTVHLPHALELDAAVLDLYDVRQLPPFEADAAEGKIAAPLGGVEHYGYAVRALADTLAARYGAGAVALVTWSTTDVQAPLSVTARAGDPLVLSLGEEEFEMDPGWPETLPEA